MTAEEFFGNHNPVFEAKELLNKFGNYTVKGEITMIGSVTQNNIYSELYYNITSHQYFLVKIFPSNKIHIDFFITNRGIQKGLFYGTNGFLFSEIGQTKDEVKTIFFSYAKDCYYIDSFVGDKIYTLYFN
jgi:hypothetical protein